MTTAQTVQQNMKRAKCISSERENAIQLDGNNDFKEIVVNIYPGFNKGIRTKKSGGNHKATGLLHSILRNARSVGYASVQGVQPVYGNWETDHCQCPKRKLKSDKSAEDELFKKILKARENKEDMQYEDGDLCVCAVEANFGIRWNWSSTLKIIWICVFYLMCIC